MKLNTCYIQFYDVHRQINNQFSSNVLFFSVLVKIRDQKRKHRFEKDVLVNYMAGNGLPSEHASVCYCRKWPNVSVPLTIHHQRTLVKAVSRTCYCNRHSVKEVFLHHSAEAAEAVG